MRYTKSAACVIAAGAAIALFGAVRTRARRKKLAGQVVVITGGSRGFGLALAREFASLGCRIAICARNRDELEQARASLARAHAEVFAVTCDISDRDEVAAMIDAVRRHYRHIDILVNNAGQIMVSSVVRTTTSGSDAHIFTLFARVFAHYLAQRLVIQGSNLESRERLNGTKLGSSLRRVNQLVWGCG